jgi:hypothetical protein
VARSTTKVSLAGLGLFAATVACAQESERSADIKKGHDLAILVCSNCHVVARDQPNEPILRTPAPSFESIAQRSGLSEKSVESFVAAVHEGMPNPRLLEYQVKPLAAYLLSLRKAP